MPKSATRPMHAKRATPEDPKVLFLPKMPEDSFCGSRRAPRHSQQKSPLSTNNLARERITANSRFLTKCYRQKAAKLPDTRRADRSGCRCRIERNATVPRLERTQLAARASINNNIYHRLMIKTEVTDTASQLIPAFPPGS